MLRINDHITIPEQEIELSAIRAQGAGGQNVNKVASAIHLRFDIKSSSLSEPVKTKLLSTKDRRISKDGILIIKAQRYRDQEKNRTDALDRMRQLIRNALVKQRKRIPTKPTKASRLRHMDAKTRQGRTKQLRKKPDME